MWQQQFVVSTLKFLGDVHYAPSASLAKPQEYQPAVSALLPLSLLSLASYASSLSVSLCSLLLTENKCCITILIWAWVWRLFFCLARGACRKQWWSSKAWIIRVMNLNVESREEEGEGVCRESPSSFFFLCLLFSVSPTNTNCLYLQDLSPLYLDCILNWQQTTKDLNASMLKTERTQSLVLQDQSLWTLFNFFIYTQ